MVSREPARCRAAVQRELREETGCVAEEWRSLGRFTVNGNQGCGRAHLFAARGARLVAEPDSGDLEDMQIVLMNADQVLASVRDGRLPLLSSAAAVALALAGPSEGRAAGPAHGRP